MKAKVSNDFEHIFGAKGGRPRVFFSPGRVNLIGEHTDYNGGHVFPCALTMGTYAAVRANDVNALRLYSCDLPETGVTSIPVGHYGEASEKIGNTGVKWTDYVLGVCDQMAKGGYPLKAGLDIVFAGDLPRASGLSSSASLEMLVAVAINDLFELNIPRLQLVKYAQKAENDYVGVSCGIMDQFAIGMGQRGAAMLLDTGTLECRHVPLALDSSNVVVVIGDTGKSRTLADSKYNERLSECRTALKMLNSGLSHLCELDMATFETKIHLITDQTILKRARHAVSENVRTLEAVDVLTEGDLCGFGRLMLESHVSLRDDYEVSCDELDLMVELLMKEQGVLGARMTGAGFGGCTVSLVERDKVYSVIEKVKSAYDAKTGRKSAFHIANVGQGTHELI